MKNVLDKSGKRPMLRPILTYHHQMDRILSKQVSRKPPRKKKIDVTRYILDIFIIIRNTTRHRTILPSQYILF